jgi:hypothetical protein
VSELKRSRLGWNPRVELVGVEWSPYHKCSTVICIGSISFRTLSFHNEYIIVQHCKYGLNLRNS